MKLTLGKATDNGAIDQIAGSWRGGRNALVSGQYGAITNEPGFDKIVDTLPGTNIGRIVLDSNLVAVFQINGDNSEIYIVDLTAYTQRLITSNVEFGFSPDFPISGEYYRNSKGQIVIAWTDNNVPPRVMNIETEYDSAIDKLTRVYLKYQLPVLSNYQIQDTGGSLVTGTHYIATAYVSIDESQTEYSPTLGPFYITDNTNIASNYDGAVANQATSKELNVTFTNVDTDYKYLVIVLISKIDNIVTAKQIKKIKISSDTINTNIQGSENEGVVAIEDIVIGSDIYDKAKAITQIDNQLFMANLSKEEEIEFQLSALNIKVNYEHTLLDIAATDLTNPKLELERGFMHNEVYALFIHLVKDDGSVTKGFHLPGRAVAVYNNSSFPEFGGVYENSKVTVASGDHITRATSIGGVNAKIFQFFDTADNPSATTNMQYYENEELYPDSPEFGTLANKPVRHHKFPALSHIKTKYYPTDNTFGKNRLTRLSLNVTNVVLPTGYIGYFISAAKRTFSNSTILAQDILLGSGRRPSSAPVPDDTEKLFWTTSGNWNVARPDQTMTADFTNLRSHAFDLFLDRPAISPNYVEAEIIIHNTDISLNYTTTRTSGWIVMSGGLDSPMREIRSVEGVELSDDNRKQDVVVIDETVGNIITEPTFPKKRFTKITGFKYIPSNIVEGLGKYINYLSEECAAITLEPNNIFTTAFNGLTLRTYDKIEAVRTTPQFTGGVGTTGKTEEVTYLYNIKQHKTDIYANMFNQDLFLINKTMAIPIDNTTVSNIKGGDVIVSDMSFATYGPAASSDTGPDNQNKGVRIDRRHICECVNFASFRYQSTDESSYFFPETPAFPFLINIDKTKIYNKWAYNKDYTAVNDINSLGINDPIENLDLTDKFPYRIIRSQINQAEEAGINNWRTFPVRDYYEMPKYRGEITNIQGVGDNLIINQKYSLYRTRNKIKLATSEGDVIAGSGDMFALPPEEIIPSSEGYAGCQHKSSCLLTKMGYTFIDAEQGKIFLLDEKLDEISLKGNTIYFFSALGGVNDNPFTDTGFTVGWDSEYNRILYSKTDDFTISYSFDLAGGNWAFDHDYNPNTMFHTREGLYSFKDNVIFKHNSLTKRGIYYTDTIYPTYIVPVFNDPKNITKYVYNIKWRSEVHNFEGGIQKNETLTHLFIWNSFQATGIIPLNNYETLSNQYNLRKTAQVWHFNRFRDLVIDSTQPFMSDFLPITGNLNVNKSFQNKRRFIDHYLLVNFIYSNQFVDGEQRNFYLYEVDVDIKPIER